MSIVAYIDGRFVPDHQAQVAFHDRGYHFADGVYEVVAYYHQTLLDAEPHLARLHRSLAAIDIAAPFGDVALQRIMRELILRNRRQHGLVYIQITRGVQRRNHASKGALAPVVTMTVIPENKKARAQAQRGVSVVTTDDQRWARCDIKSISLLPNVRAKAVAQRAEVYEVWMHRGGVVTEASAANAYIIKDNVLITHPETHAILGGIVRQRVLECAQEVGVKVGERSFTIEEACAADEAFVSSSSAHMIPVVKIDDTKIGTGMPGSLTQKLQRAYDAHVKTQTGYELNSVTA